MTCIDAVLLSQAFILHGTITVRKNSLWAKISEAAGDRLRISPLFRIPHHSSSTVTGREDEQMPRRFRFCMSLFNTFKASNEQLKLILAIV